MSSASGILNTAVSAVGNNLGTAAWFAGYDFVSGMAFGLVESLNPMGGLVGGLLKSYVDNLAFIAKLNIYQAFAKQ